MMHYKNTWTISTFMIKTSSAPTKYPMHPESCAGPFPKSTIELQWLNLRRWQEVNVSFFSSSWCRYCTCVESSLWRKNGAQNSCCSLFLLLLSLFVVIVVANKRLSAPSGSQPSTPLPWHWGTKRIPPESPTSVKWGWNCVDRDVTTQNIWKKSSLMCLLHWHRFFFKLVYRIVVFFQYFFSFSLGADWTHQLRWWIFRRSKHTSMASLSSNLQVKSMWTNFQFGIH